MDAELKAEVEELIERARVEVREERTAALEHMLLRIAEERDAAIERTQAAARVEIAHVLHRRSFRQDFLPNLAIAIVMIVGAWMLVTYEKRVDCHSRQSARNDLRAAVSLAVEGKDPNDPRLKHWFDAIAPGGSFSVIRC